MLPAGNRVTGMIKDIFPGIDLYCTDTAQHTITADWALDDLDLDLCDLSAPSPCSVVAPSCPTYTPVPLPDVLPDSLPDAVYGGVSPKHPRLSDDRQALPQEPRGRNMMGGGALYLVSVGRDGRICMIQAKEGHTEVFARVLFHAWSCKQVRRGQSGGETLVRKFNDDMGININTKCSLYLRTLFNKIVLSNMNIQNEN